MAPQAPVNGRPDASDGLRKATGSGRSRAAATPRAATVSAADSSFGPTEAAVRADVQTLRVSGADVQESLAQMAYHLARKLDQDAGLATAAVARELRATLTALTPKEEANDGDDLAGLLAALSSPVEHTAH